MFKIAQRNYEIEVGEVAYEEALKKIRNVFSEPGILPQEAHNRISRLQIDAMRGIRGAAEELSGVIKEYLEMFKITVTDMSLDEAAHKIYTCTWGLGVIEEVYNQPDVDEVEVIGPDTVYTIRRGKYFRENITFKSEEELFNMIKRLLRSDRVDLSEHTPVARSVREDGTRVVATGPPVTNELTLTLRKHGTYLLTKENLLENGTMDEQTYEKLALFTEAGLNIVYSGPVNSGKTSDIRRFFRYCQPELRTLVIEPDRELRLREHYPGWNIIELVEQKKVGADIQFLIETALQLTPVRVVIGEILSFKELNGAIKAGLRGQSGNISSFHSKSTLQALHNLALIFVGEGGARIETDVAMRWIVQAFDVIVQLWTLPKLGIKKVVHVATPYFDKNGAVQLYDIVTWEGSEEGYHIGKWIHHPLPEPLKKKMYENGVPLSRIRELG